MSGSKPQKFLMDESRERDYYKFWDDHPEIDMDEFIVQAIFLHMGNHIEFEHAIKVAKTSGKRGGDGTHRNGKRLTRGN